MKKMIMMAVMAVTMCASVFAQQNAEFWQKKIAESKNEGDKVIFTARLNVFNANPTSFNEIRSIIEKTFADSETILSKFDKERTKYWCFSTICMAARDKFPKETFDFAVNDSNQFYIVLWRQKKMEMNNQEAGRILAKYIIDGSVKNIYYVKQGIEKLIPYLNEFEDEAEAKNILKKLNRTLSPKLLDDKATWEPIVARVRTVLETY